MAWKSPPAAWAGFARTVGRWLGRVTGRSCGIDPDLARMSERELRDLGIGRGEVGWWSDPRAASPRTACDGGESGDASGRR